MSVFRKSRKLMKIGEESKREDGRHGLRLGLWVILAVFREHGWSVMTRKGGGKEEGLLGSQGKNVGIVIRKAKKIKSHALE